MPGLVLNTAQAMKQREALPEGEYHATFVGHRIQDADPKKQDSYPAIVAEFVVHEDEGPEYAGRHAWRNLSASPKAVPFMVDAALALGADPDDVIQPDADMDAIFRELHGTECWIKTTIRTWQRNPDEAPIEQTNVDKIMAQPSA